MSHLRRSLIVASVIILGSLSSSNLTWLGGAGPAQAAVLYSSKIDPAVIAATTSGGGVPFLLVLSDQADLSGADRLLSKSQKGQLVFNALLATATRTQPPIRAILDKLKLVYRPYYIVNAFAVENGTLSVLQQLASLAAVSRIEADNSVRMTLPIPRLAPELMPAGPVQVEWGIGKINAPAVWAMGFKGRGVVYANADTGVQWNHPALIAEYRGWNGSTVNHNFNWWDAVHKDVSGNRGNPCGLSVRFPCDDYGHGTHTLGTGVGYLPGKDHIGVAPGARWIACRNMDQGVGRPSQYIECFQFFLAPWDLKMMHANPNRAADIISNSWTCPLGAPPQGENCTPDSLKKAVQVERSAGIFVVASAGNDGSAICSTVDQPPAIYDASTTVGATDSSDDLAGFSSVGPVTVDGSKRIKPDLVAPGVDVRSSFPGSSYAYMSGTSMSAPHVAGAVALLWSAHPEMRGRVTWTENILFKSAMQNVTAVGNCGGTSAANIPNNLFGYGRVDVLAAVKSVQ